MPVRNSNPRGRAGREDINALEQTKSPRLSMPVQIFRQNVQEGAKVHGPGGQKQRARAGGVGWCVVSPHMCSSPYFSGCLSFLEGLEEVGSTIGAHLLGKRPARNIWGIVALTGDPLGRPNASSSRGQGVGALQVRPRRAPTPAWGRCSSTTRALLRRNIRATTSWVPPRSGIRQCRRGG